MIITPPKPSTTKISEHLYRKIKHTDKIWKVKAHLIIALSKLLPIKLPVFTGNNPLDEFSAFYDEVFEKERLLKPFLEVSNIKEIPFLNYQGHQSHNVVALNKITQLFPDHEKTVRKFLQALTRTHGSDFYSPPFSFIGNGLEMMSEEFEDMKDSGEEIDTLEDITLDQINTCNNELFKDNPTIYLARKVLAIPASTPLAEHLHIMAKTMTYMIRHKIEYAYDQTAYESVQENFSDSYFYPPTTLFTDHPNVVESVLDYLSDTNLEEIECLSLDSPKMNAQCIACNTVLQTSLNAIANKIQKGDDHG